MPARYGVFVHVDNRYSELAPRSCRIGPASPFPDQVPSSVRGGPPAGRNSLLEFSLSGPSLQQSPTARVSRAEGGRPPACSRASLTLVWRERGRRKAASEKTLGETELSGGPWAWVALWGGCQSGWNGLSGLQAGNHGSPAGPLRRLCRNKRAWGLWSLQGLHLCAHEGTGKRQPRGAKAAD